MCSSNYSAENTLHSFGPQAGRRAVDLQAAGRSGRRGKRYSLLDSGASIHLFRLGLLLLWVKLERTTRWNGLGPGQGSQKSQWFDCARWLRALSQTNLLYPTINHKGQIHGRCASTTMLGLLKTDIIKLLCVFKCLVSEPRLCSPSCFSCVVKSRID